MRVHMLEHSEEDGRYADCESDSLIENEVTDALTIERSTGQDQTSAGHASGICEAPAVRMEQWNDREQRVLRTDRERVRCDDREGMKDRRAVAVEHALRMAAGEERRKRARMKSVIAPAVALHLIVEPLSLTLFLKCSTVRMRCSHRTAAK